MAVAERDTSGPVAIVGLGLIGGSVAKALARAYPNARRIGIEPNAAARARALREAAVHAAEAAPGALLQDCRLVFICTPGANPRQILRGLAPHLAPNAVLTDVIGIKGPVHTAVRDILPAHAFVGGHPMAGGPQGGYAAARADLFANTPVALTTDDAPSATVAWVESIWRAVGAVPQRLSAQEHDRQAALTSHLPYAVAVSLAEMLAQRGPPSRLVGRGLESVLRQARFAPEVMASVAGANPFLPSLLRELATTANALADALDADGTAAMRRWGERARDLVAKLRADAP